jgi:tetratricopeptide (TPR) repeat protein
MGTFALALLVSGLPGVLRASLIGYAAVLLLAAGLTGTRAAAVGVAVAAGVFVVLISAKHPSGRARLLGLTSGLGAAAVLVGLLLLTPLGSRFLSTVDGPSAAPSDDGGAGQLELSARTRLAIYSVAARMVIDRPLLGYGPDNFAAALPSYRPEGAPPQIRQSIVTSTHGWIAAVATSSGILGLVAFLAAIGTAALVLLRSAYSTIGVVAAVVTGAYLGSGAVTISALETDTLCWLGLAAIAGATASRPIVPHATRTRSARAGPAGSGSAIRVWIPWLAVVAATAVAGTALSALDASHLAQRSVGLRTPGTAASAIDLAKRSTQRDPNRAEYWQQLALAYVAGSYWTDASIAFQAGAKLAPYDIRFLTDAIQVQLVFARNGDGKALERAQQLADQAVGIDPNNPNAHLNRAVVLFQRGDSAQALDAIDRALVLDPNSINSQLPGIAVQIYVAATRSDVAADRIDEAIVKARHGVALLGANTASVPLRLELARTLVRGGRAREALDALDAALAIVPSDQSLLQLKAEILRTQ